jgi:steroid 5-alpha reductase family enzyme
VQLALLVIAAVSATMLATWAVSLRCEDASVVDLVWGPAFALVALVAALGADPEADASWLMFGLTALWGLRLGWHLSRRKRTHPGEDRRYAALRERHRDRFASWSLLWVFAAQGLLILLVSLPLQVAATQPAPLTPLILPGVLLFALGFAFEAIGDAQLSAFRADPANAGAVMDRGLWRWTRHPNYFGDCCVWWGIWLVALTAGGTWWTAAGPLAMTFLLVRGSGKRLLERDIAERRPGYAGYARRTSGFFPLPPRG